MISVNNMAMLLPQTAPRDMLKWATVTAISPLRIKVDGDTSALPFTPSTLELGLAVTDRVLAAFVTNDDPQFMGQRVVVLGRGGGTIVVPAHTHPTFPLGELGFGERTSDSGLTSSTTEKPILSLEDIAIGSGRSISVFTNTVSVASTVNNDSYTVRLRYTTDGSTPTVSSPELGSATWQSIDVQGSGSAIITRSYRPAVAESLSVLLTLTRRTGSGQLQTVGRVQITVQDIGVAVANTGTAL